MSKKWNCIACGKHNYAENLRCAHCGVASEELSQNQRNQTYSESVKSIPLSEYRCSKCNGGDFDVGEVLMSGGPLSALFNVQNRKFFNLSCKGCGYTEFYKGSVSNRQKLLDLITG